MAKNVKNHNDSYKLSGFHKDGPYVVIVFIRVIHLINVRYIINEFPLGFKSKKLNNHLVNQISSSPIVQESDVPQLSFQQEQCQKILALIKPLDSTHSVNQLSTCYTTSSSSSYGILTTPNTLHSENLSSNKFFLNLPIFLRLSTLELHIIWFVLYQVFSIHYFDHSFIYEITK